VLFVFLIVALTLFFVVFLTVVSVTLILGAVVAAFVFTVGSTSATIGFFVLVGVASTIAGVTTVVVAAGCVECFKVYLLELLILRFLPMVGAPCVYIK